MLARGFIGDANANVVCVAAPDAAQLENFLRLLPRIGIVLLV